MLYSATGAKSEYKKNRSYLHRLERLQNEKSLFDLNIVRIAKMLVSNIFALGSYREVFISSVRRDFIPNGQLPHLPVDLFSNRRFYGL